MTPRGEKLYEGKAKILYATTEPGPTAGKPAGAGGGSTEAEGRGAEDAELVVQYFKDDATAFNAQKRGTIVDKGVVNNRVSSALFTYLERRGIPTHFVKQLDDRSMLVKRLEIVPLEVTIRNITAGGMSRLLGIEEGIVLAHPVFEWHYKSDALGDPLINDDHILAMGWATAKELDHIRAESFKVNDALTAFFRERQIDLVDFKLEFGRVIGSDGKPAGRIVLGDEISPDTMRLWEQGTQRKLDKDRFRRDLGSVEEAYQEVLRRVLGETSTPANHQ